MAPYPNEKKKSFDLWIFRAIHIDTFASKWQRIRDAPLSKQQAYRLTFRIATTKTKQLTRPLRHVVTSKYTKSTEKHRIHETHILTYATHTHCPCITVNATIFSFCRTIMTSCLVAVREFNDKQVLYIFCAKIVIKKITIGAIAS